MENVQIDGTDIVVSRLSFGTAALHHAVFRSDRQRILSAALALGLTHFDTSPYYGFGLAEGEIGSVIRNRRDRVTIATKVGLYPPFGIGTTGVGVWIRKAIVRSNRRRWSPKVDWDIQRLQESLNGSLRRLQTDYVDFLLLHEPHYSALATDEVLAWLQRQQNAGKVRYWGVAGELSGFYPWVACSSPLTQVIQTRDSLLGREANALRGLGRRLQFTYGYFSSSAGPKSLDSTLRIASRALEQNEAGSVVFSTSNLERIRAIASVASR